MKTVIHSIIGLLLAGLVLVAYQVVRLLYGKTESEKYVSNIINNSSNALKSEMLRQYLGRDKSK
jgi:hypothetical protein